MGMDKMDETIVVQTEQTEMNKQLTECRETLIESQKSLMGVSQYCDQEYSTFKSAGQLE